MTTNGTKNGAASAAAPSIPAPALATFSEAPASVNTRVSWRGHDLQLTLRGESGAQVLVRLDAALTWLAEHGAVPSAGSGHRAHSDPYGGPGAGTDGQTAPTCPTHGRPMRQGKRGGWYCPAKLADDDGTGKPLYCRHKATGEGGGR